MRQSFLMRASDYLSAAVPTWIVAAWNGVNATILWVSHATDIIGLLSAVVALTCGGFTLYGHLERLREKRAKKGDQ